MSHTMVQTSSLLARPAIATDLIESDMMISPKWGVLAVIAAAFALAASYDMRLGMAVGAGIGILAAIYLWIRFRLSFEPGPEGSKRAMLAARLRRLGANRREALAREGDGAPVRARFKRGWQKLRERKNAS